MDGDATPQEAEMKFDDLKISTKVALPAIILTVVALAIVGMGAWQARKAEQANTRRAIAPGQPGIESL